MLKLQANIATQRLESFLSCISYAGLIAGAALLSDTITFQFCVLFVLVFLCVVLFYGLIAGPAANNFPLPTKEIYMYPTTLRKIPLSTKRN